MYVIEMSTFSNTKVAVCCISFHDILDANKISTIILYLLTVMYVDDRD